MQPEDSQIDGFHSPAFQNFAIHQLPIGQLEELLQMFESIDKPQPATPIATPITGAEITAFQAALKSVKSLKPEATL